MTLKRNVEGADLERVDRLQHDYETEIGRILQILRKARHEIACAHDRLHKGLSLELYMERKARDRA